MNIAHFLTLLRIFIIPFFPIVYLYHENFKIGQKVALFILIFILIICELSDVIDGILARKKNQVTAIGKIIDPMADSIVHISVFFTFTQGIVSLPIMLVFILLYRELVISSLRTICALKGVALAARKTGKIKAIMQAVVSFLIVILMIFYSFGYISLNMLQKISFFSVLVVACYTVFTLVDYFFSNRKYLKKLII